MNRTLLKLNYLFDVAPRVRNTNRRIIL